MRKFEKISYDQFKKDFEDSKELYDKITLPVRSTKHSAAYDIKSMEEKTLHPGDSLAFKTGLKYDVSLTNCVGVIDSDFYNNEDNEGHFKVKLINHGDKDFEVKVGDRIAQGVFMKYLTVDDEEAITNVRTGGIGSTNKGGR